MSASSVVEDVLFKDAVSMVHYASGYELVQEPAVPSDTRLSGRNFCQKSPCR